MTPSQIFCMKLCILIDTSLIIAAVQRKYESVRRQWKLKEKDDFEEASKQLSISKRYRARRKRVSLICTTSIITKYHY